MFAKRLRTKLLLVLGFEFGFELLLVLGFEEGSSFFCFVISPVGREITTREGAEAAAQEEMTVVVVVVVGCAGVLGGEALTTVEEGSTESEFEGSTTDEEADVSKEVSDSGIGLWDGTSKVGTEETEEEEEEDEEEEEEEEDEDDE